MKPINKWISMLGVAIAILLLLYYAGVVHSKLFVGVALTAMSVLLFVSVLVTPRVGDSNDSKSE